MAGIYGVGDKARELELDRYLNKTTGWTDAQIKEAINSLHDAIIDGKVQWDENIEGYRDDMRVRFDNIMFSKLSWDEKKFALEDAMDECVTAYCKAEVERDPDYYCNYYEV